MNEWKCADVTYLHCLRAAVLNQIEPGLIGVEARMLGLERRTVPRCSGPCGVEDVGSLVIEGEGSFPHR